MRGFPDVRDEEMRADAACPGGELLVLVGRDRLLLHPRQSALVVRQPRPIRVFVGLAEYGVRGVQEPETGRRWLGGDHTEEAAHDREAYDINS